MKGRVNIITDDPIMGNLLEVQLAEAGFEAENFSTDGMSVLTGVPENILGADPEERERMLIIADGAFLRSDSGIYSELRRRLRQHPDTAGIPFVFLMSGTDIPGHTEGLKTGADGYVCKPFKTEDLLTQMENVTRLARKARTFRSQNDFGDELSQMSLYDAVRIAELNCKSGELVLKHPSEKIKGKAFFAKGKLIAAETEHLQGQEAFFSLIGEDAGRIEFYGHEISDTVSEQIKDSNMAVLLRASRMAEDAAKLYYRIPGTDDLLKVKSRHIPPELEKDLGKEYPEKILSMIEKGQRVREIVADTGMSSIRAGSLIMRLLDADVVSAAAHPEPLTPNPAQPQFHPPKFIGRMLTDALRKAQQDKMTGVLKFGNSSRTKAAVYFEKGQLIHAWHGRVFGKKSLYRIFSESSKTARLKADSVSSPSVLHKMNEHENHENFEFQDITFAVPVTVKESLNFLFAQGDNEVAVLSRLRPASFEKSLALNPDAAEQIAAIRNRAGLVYVLALVQQYSRVKDILDASCMTDLQTYKYLLYLFQKGMLVAAPKIKAGIRIITDTGADLPPEMLRETNITVIPLSIMMHQKTWQEGLDISYQEFYRIMADADMPPRIFPPAEAHFQELFGKILADEDILCVFMSADMGKACHHAASASAGYRNNAHGSGREARLETVDSRLLSLGTGLLVIEAYQKVQAGWSLEKVRAHLLKIIPGVRVFVVADTPKYLPKEKRFGRESGLSRLRDILGVKPILTIQDGQLTAIDFVRGIENARKVLGELICESLSDSDTPIKAGIMHSGAEAEAAVLRRFLEQELNCQEIITSHIGAALGAYCGPGAVGIAFFPTQM